jgi:hypothetical protein
MHVLVAAMEIPAIRMLMAMVEVLSTLVPIKSTLRRATPVMAQLQFSPQLLVYFKT